MPSAQCKVAGSQRASRATAMKRRRRDTSRKDAGKREGVKGRKFRKSGTDLGLPTKHTKHTKVEEAEVAEELNHEWARRVRI